VYLPEKAGQTWKWGMADFPKNPKSLYRLEQNAKVLADLASLIVFHASSGYQPLRGP